jgi:hypothetical protein
MRVDEYGAVVDRQMWRVAKEHVHALVELLAALAPDGPSEGWNCPPVQPAGPVARRALLS